MIIQIVSSPYFLKNYYFLTPDMHTYVCVSEVRKFSFSENFASVLSE